MKSVKEAEIKPGQTVLLRTDFNVPLRFSQGQAEIVDDFRLKAALPTIKFLQKLGAKIILLSHLGRPGGKKKARFRLDPVRDWLKTNLGTNQIRLLENLRFHPGEEKNDPEFAKRLASRGEIFVNDAFAVCHRRHASIVGLPRFLPSFAGLRLILEIQGLKKATEAKQDLVVILGGTKTETKIPVIKSLAKQKAVVLLGGLVANTFLASLLGKSRVNGSAVDQKRLFLAKKFLKTLDRPITFGQIPGKTTKIWLPLDVLVGPPPLKEIVFFPHQEKVPSGKTILDIGPRTIKEYTGLLRFAKAIILNGPLGKVEKETCRQGTKKIMETIADSEAFSVVGGGETIAALEKFGLTDKIDLVSTGGGAMLAYLAKGTLPGIEALENKKQ